MRMCSKKRPYICACPMNGDMCNDEILDNEYCHAEHNKWLSEKIKENITTEITIKHIEKVMEPYES